MLLALQETFDVISDLFSKIFNFLIITPASYVYDVFNNLFFSRAIELKPNEDNNEEILLLEENKASKKQSNNTAENILLDDKNSKYNSSNVVIDYQKCFYIALICTKYIFNALVFTPFSMLLGLFKPNKEQDIKIDTSLLAIDYNRHNNLVVPELDSNINTDCIVRFDILEIYTVNMRLQTASYLGLTQLKYSNEYLNELLKNSMPNNPQLVPSIVADEDRTDNSEASAAPLRIKAA